MTAFSCEQDKICCVDSVNQASDQVKSWKILMVTCMMG